MIEQVSEKKIVDALSAALPETANITVIGAWQPSTDGAIKSLEDGTAEGYLTVRMQPRSYETPTIPTAQIACTISLAMRAEVDADGQNYLAVTDAVTNVLQQWQNDISAVVSTFGIEGKFDATGFQLTGGDAGIDKANKVWSWAQSLIVYGVVLPPQPQE